MIAISDNWNCPNCGELSEIQFKRCWNCGADRAGTLDPHFQIESMPQMTLEKRDSWLVGFAWLLAWIAVCILVLAAAGMLESWLPRFWIVRLSLASVLLLFCLLTAVFINVLSRLYLWLRKYLYADQPDDSPSRQAAGGQQKTVQLEGSPDND